MQYFPHSLSVCNNDSCKENIINNDNDENHELVILSKQTLTQAQKNMLRKGLSFILKPKKTQHPPAS